MVFPPGRVVQDRLARRRGDEAGACCSYLSASTGERVAARKAGYTPESSPIRVAKTGAAIGRQTGVKTATLGGTPPDSAACPAR